jgi:hypothetical protein
VLFYGLVLLSVQKGFPVPDLRNSLVTKDGIMQFADFILSNVRKTFDEEGRFFALAFVVGRRHPKTGEVFSAPQPIPIDISSMGKGNEKDRVLAFIQNIAKKADGFAVLFISEVWIKIAKNYTQADIDRMSVNGVEAEPDRQEGIHVVLDHPEVQYQWWALITRDAQGHPTLGLFEGNNVAPGTSEGRFSSFIAPEPKASA